MRYVRSPKCWWTETIFPGCREAEPVPSIFHPALSSNESAAALPLDSQTNARRKWINKHLGHRTATSESGKPGIVLESRRGRGGMSAGRRPSRARTRAAWNRPAISQPQLPSLRLCRPQSPPSSPFQSPALGARQSTVYSCALQLTLAQVPSVPSSYHELAWTQCVLRNVRSVDYFFLFSPPLPSPVKINAVSQLKRRSACRDAACRGAVRTRRRHGAVTCEHVFSTQRWAVLETL